MRILIYGAKGWIGEQFVNILNVSVPRVDYKCGVARCDNYDAIEKEVDDVNPSHIISFIGRTHGKIGDKEYTTIDYLEQDGKLLENVRDNLFSPFLLATISKKKGIHYTYLGTGCIFAYDKTHTCPAPDVNKITAEFIKTGVSLNGQLKSDLTGFTEESEANFFGSSYSTVKGFTDKIMHLYEETVLNLRIRMPITGHKNGRNFITKITTYDKICSMPNSMTVLPELLPIVLDMMKKKTTGTMNLTNPGVISHNEILEMYKEIVDPNFKWKNFTKEEQRAIIASDRSNNYLETSRLERLYPNVNNIKAAVRKCLLCYKIDLYAKNATNQTKEMNLLVTGGCGFIGSNFINYYFNKYNQETVTFTSNNSYKLNKLVNIDAMYYCASKDNVLPSIQSDPNYVFINGNICETSIVNHILEYYKITHVIHFAAQSHVDNSFEDSIKFTHDNILGTHILLECCRKYGKLNKFIHVSTDEVYGESMNFIEEHKKTEHSILCPTNPYAATKAGAELIAQSYNHSYKMPIIITRGNNVYGPNQYPEKIIPKFVKLLKEDKKLTIQGDGSSVRAFLHAIDTAKAFELILHQGEIGEIYNIGCDEGMEYSVMDVAKILIKMIKGTENYSDWIEFVQDRPFNDKRYYISNEKLKKFGWNIEVDLMRGLEGLMSAK